MTADSSVAFVGSLRAIRTRLGVTQVDLAEVMESVQPAVSRIERQDDVLLSTLVSYVEALGGRLRLVIDHPTGSYEIQPRCRGCGSTIAGVHKWPIRHACSHKSGSRPAVPPGQPTVT